MPQHNYLQALYLSFYSAPLYRDVGRRWKGTGYLYLLVLLALVWIPEMAQFHYKFSASIEEEGRAVAYQIPAITISDGEVSTDVETPYFIRDPKKGQVWAIIDLTGQYNSLAGTDAEVLLTKTQMFVRQRRGTVNETRVYDLSAVKSFTLTRDDVSRWLELAKAWTAIVLYPLAVLFAFVYRILQTLLYALIGLLIARSLKIELSYGTLVRLAVVALTPVIVLDTLRSLASIHIPALWLFAFAVAMGYLIFAIKANAAPADTQQPGSEPLS